MSPSGVSKVLARLEERLGVRLMNRTTRNVSLTADGDAFFERCRQILSELEEAESAVTGRVTTLQGRFRLQTPVAFGRKIVIPLLAQFVKANKGLVVDVELSDRVPDLAEEGLDAVVHIGDVQSSSVMVRKLCNLRYVTVASPDYLAQYGEPMTPDDLQRHSCLAYYVPHTNRYRDWHFDVEGQHLSKAISGALNINSAEGLLDAVLAGAGIATISTFIAADAVKSSQVRAHHLAPLHLRRTGDIDRLSEPASSFDARSGVRRLSGSPNVTRAAMGRHYRELNGAAPTDPSTVKRILAAAALSTAQYRYCTLVEFVRDLIKIHHAQNMITETKHSVDQEANRGSPFQTVKVRLPHDRCRSNIRK